MTRQELRRWSGGVVLALATVQAGQAWAQDASGRADDIVVTAARTTPRLATETSAPVDSLKGGDLRERGAFDLNNALLAVEPSLNFGNPVYGGAAANSRGPTLRGLAQDQVLVLIDGKRWHGSSLINFNNTLGRGEVPWDFNMIPLAAIKRVEVLRDGAAAQYGSDAIAGVINVILRDDVSGAEGTVQAGITDSGDGFHNNQRVSAGTRIGEGSLALFAERQDRDAINRARIDSRYKRVTNQQGELPSLNYNLGATGRWQFGEHASFYLDLLYAHRDAQGAVRFRDPGTSSLFPNGFLPIVATELEDFSALAGMRGDLGGWNLDLSNSYGSNRADFEGRNTVNTDLGAASPTTFDGGGARYRQNVVDFTVNRDFDLLAGLSIAAGGEWRHERYKIRSGEPASFTGAGASGAAGFNPARPVDIGRDAVAAFAEAELSILDSLRVGGAIRHEHYDDFGDTTNWKARLFFKPVPFLALRGTASTGFRAPSLQQQYFSLVRSQAVNGVIETTGTYAATDPVSLAVGSSPLKPEKSKNLSAGLVLTPTSELTFSFDYFHIAIDDRIALSESLPRTNTAVGAALRAAGITNVQSVSFFTNAIDTTTEGFEVAGHWTRRFGGNSTLTLGAAYSQSDTDLDQLRRNPTVSSLPLLAERSLILLLDSKPKNRINFSAAWSGPVLDATLDVNRFGGFLGYANTKPQNFGAETTVDLGLTVHLERRVDFGLGVLNLTNAYPDELVDIATTQGGSIVYPEAGSVGVRGREFYVRVTLRP